MSIELGEHSCNDLLPHVFAHEKRILVEKATEQLLRAEIQDSLCERVNDSFRDVEPGQNYPVNTFR